MKSLRVVFACAFGVSALSCLSPTEIVLELSTNVACIGEHGVAVAVGDPNDDSTGVAASGPGCTSDGGLGKVVIVPRGAIDAPIGIRVTLGVDAGADQCVAPKFEGCIVARRSLRFDPHTPLTLPIELDQSCVGVPCTPDSTCVSGACVDAGVSCDGGSCNVESDGGPPPPPPGTCVDTIGAVPVQNNLQAGSEARIVRTRTGWAILYMNDTGALAIDTIVMTPTVNIGAPVTLPATQVSGMGTFGTDGDSFALTYASGLNTAGEIGDASPVGQTLGATPGKDGMFLVDDAGTWATTLINDSSQGQPEIMTLTQTAGFSFHPAFSVTAGGANISLTRNATDANEYYAAMNDGSRCYAFRCPYTNVFTCSIAYQRATCNGVRAAARGTTAAFAATDSTNDTLYLGQFGIGSVDTGIAHFAIVATQNDFPVPHVRGGLLQTARYDGVNQPLVGPRTTNIAGSIDSLDAVADDPTQAGYALALVSGTSLYFMHICN